MSETEIKAAIAQQEEHIRRSRACPGTAMEHSWDKFSIRPGVFYKACWRCQVTRSDEDYQKKIGLE